MSSADGQTGVTVSVIVRAKDRAHTIASTIESVRAQTLPAEIVVVDSGSRDGTVEIARELADTVIEIPPQEFTYGGALNTGAQAASGEIHIALSAHCALADRDWINVAVSHFRDPSVAAVSGDRFGPTGELLTAPVRHDGDPDNDVNPYWGYANHAGAWRATAWRDFPFSTELIACEDKEWDIRVRRAGWAILIDPRLTVRAKHRRREGMRALFNRAQREGEAIGIITGRRRLTSRGALREWLTLQQRSAAVQLANPYRMIDIFGRYMGERAASRG